MKILNKLKEYDIYRARWKVREWADQKDHCFEGLLVALKDNDNQIRFYDTYWGICNRSGKSFNPKEVQELFDIKFYCNLDELEEKSKYQTDYYDDDDIYYLHNQHACMESCRSYYVKKGTKKSKQKILSVINKKIIEAEHTIESAITDIERYSEKKIEVQNGDLSIYLQP